MVDQGTNSLIGGLADGLNKYLGVKQQYDAASAASEQKQTGELKNKLIEQQNQATLDTTKTNNENKFKNNLEDVLTPGMAEKAMPGYGAQMVNDYNKARPDNPLKLKEGVDFLKNAVDNLSKKDEKQQKSDDTRLTQWARTLSGDREFTNVRTKRDNLENMGGLLDQVASQKEGPDRRQMMEQAMGQVRVLINTGQISEKEIEHLMPSTFKGKIAQGLEYFTNQPESTDAQDFTKRARDFFHRESDITNNQFSRRVNELSAPYSGILDRNQDVASETYKTYGVNHPKYNPKHDEKATAPRPGMTPPKEDPLGLFK